jgi:hypothetical protein
MAYQRYYDRWQQTLFLFAIFTDLHHLSIAPHFKTIRNTWEVLKYGAGEGWRSVGPIM